MCKKVVFRRKRSFPLGSYIEVRYIILQSHRRKCNDADQNNNPFFTIADYEKEQEYIFALLFGILICLYLLVCKNICKLLNNRMHAP